jgi:predicted dienelactone hydrolase
VLTQILAAADTPGDALRGRIDAGAGAALGQSLGGPAVLALTRKACCRDERVRASVVVAAPWQLSAGYGPDPLAAIGPATLILHGTADATVAFAMAQQLFNILAPPRLLVGIQGAGHSESLESQVEPPIAARAAAQRAVIAFLAATFRDRDRALDNVLADLSAEGHVVER